MTLPKWLKKTLLACLSLTMAFALWIISIQGRIDFIWIPNTQIKLLNIPEFITIAPLPQVSIYVQYPDQVTNQIRNPSNFIVEVDASQILPRSPEDWVGPLDPHTFPITLNPSDVKIFDLPPDVQVTQIRPKDVRIDAAMQTSKLTVVVPTTGTLQESLVLIDLPQPEQNTLLATGSDVARQQLALAGDIIKTEPINLSEVKTSAQFPQKLLIPEGITLLDSKFKRNKNAQTYITVSVAVKEQDTTHTLSKIPFSFKAIAPDLRIVTTPESADVLLQGPLSALNTITPKDISFSLLRNLPEGLGERYEVGVEASLRDTVPDTVAMHVRIIEVRPSRISVEFIKAGQPSDEEVKPIQ